jgi:hypothetical protein
MKSIDHVWLGRSEGLRQSIAPGRYRAAGYSSVPDGTALKSNLRSRDKTHVKVSWPPKTVPVFVDQWSGKEWHGNGIRMRTH